MRHYGGFLRSCFVRCCSCRRGHSQDLTCEAKQRADSQQRHSPQAIHPKRNIRAGGLEGGVVFLQTTLPSNGRAAGPVKDGTKHAVRGEPGVDS